MSPISEFCEFWFGLIHAAVLAGSVTDSASSCETVPTMIAVSPVVHESAHPVAHPVVGPMSGTTAYANERAPELG
jgi:hypothetical protein